MEIEENRCLINKKASKDQWASLFNVSFCQFSFGALILFSLSYSWTLRVFLEHSWRVWHTWMLGTRRQRKSRKEQEGIGIRSYNSFFLQVPSCMYVCLISFGMKGICMRSIGHDLPLAWRITQIESGFPQPCHFQESHGVVDPFLCFFGWFSCFLQLGLSYQFMEALVGQMLWKTCNRLS